MPPLAAEMNATTYSGGTVAPSPDSHSQELPTTQADSFRETSGHADLSFKSYCAAAANINEGVLTICHGQLLLVLSEGSPALLQLLTCVLLCVLACFQGMCQPIPTNASVETGDARAMKLTGRGDKSWGYDATGRPPPGEIAYTGRGACPGN